MPAGRGSALLISYFVASFNPNNRRNFEKSKMDGWMDFRIIHHVIMGWAIVTTKNELTLTSSWL